MHVNSYFDKVVVINIDRRIDRMNNISNQLNSLGIEYERFSAFDGLSLKINPIKAVKMSHLKVLEDNLGKRILILEDDALFQNDFIDRFNEAMPHLPADTEIFYLGAYMVRCKDVGNPYWVRNTYSTGLQAYCILPHKMNYIVDKIKTFESHIDVEISNLNLNSYILSENIVTQYPSYSDIRLKEVDDFRYPLKVQKS